MIAVYVENKEIKMKVSSKYDKGLKIGEMTFRKVSDFEISLRKFEASNYKQMMISEEIVDKIKNENIQIMIRQYSIILGRK